MKRLLYLDSLRGIAALIVVLFHLIDPFFSYYSFNLSDSSINLAKVLTRTLFNGTDWVSFFFVLSGLSLSLSIIKNGGIINYKAYFLRRLFRIVPLYFLVLFVSFFFFNENVSYFQFFSQLLLVNFKNNLVPQSWSLSVELIISFILPFLILIFLNNKKSISYFLFVSLLLFNSIGQSQSSASGFIFHFVLGIILADILLQKKLIDKKIFLIAIPLIFFSFSVRWGLDLFPNIKYYIQVFTDFLNMDYHQLFFFISAIGSFFIIYIAISSNYIQLILSNKILIYSGKISFSVYLTHFLLNKVFYREIVFFIKPVNNVFIESGLSIFIQLTIIFTVSSLTYILVEKPFINISKKFLIKV